MAQRRRNIMRPIAVAVVMAFAAEQAAFAAPAMPAIMPTSLTPVVGFRLPESVAVVDDAYKAPGSSKLIVLIQDAHTNDSGQMSVAKALAEILPKEKITTVFTEADSGDVSLNYLKPFFTQKVREEVGRSLVRKGLLRGHDYANLTGQNFTLWGVEDPALYQKTLEVYKDITLKRDKVRSYVDRVQRAADVIKGDVFSDEVRALDIQRIRNVKGQLSLADYAELLLEKAGKAGLSTARYPHIKFLRRLRAIEKRVDFKKASAEEREAIKVVSQADRDVLLAAHKTSPKSTTEENGYYTLFAEKLKGHESGFPNLVKYFAYLKETRKMNALGVVGEVKGLEEDLFMTLAKTRDEAVLWTFGRNLETLQNLIALKVSPEEYNRIKTESALYDIKLIAGFLNRKISDADKHYENALTLEASYEAVWKDATNFYELTLKRDRVFFEHLTDKMTADNLDKAVLITGGYHTPNLKAMLKSAGISYVSLLPQVLAETDTPRYERLLLAQLNDQDSDTGNRRIASGARPARNEATMIAQEPVERDLIPGLVKVAGASPDLAKRVVAARMAADPEAVIAKVQESLQARIISFSIARALIDTAESVERTGPEEPSWSGTVKYSLVREGKQIATIVHGIDLDLKEYLVFSVKDGESKDVTYGISEPNQRNLVYEVLKLLKSKQSGVAQPAAAARMAVDPSNATEFDQWLIGDLRSFLNQHQMDIKWNKPDPTKDEWLVEIIPPNNQKSRWALANLLATIRSGSTDPKAPNYSGVPNLRLLQVEESRVAETDGLGGVKYLSFWSNHVAGLLPVIRDSLPAETTQVTRSFGGLRTSNGSGFDVTFLVGVIGSANAELEKLGLSATGVVRGANDPAQSHLELLVAGDRATLDEKNSDRIEVALARAFEAVLGQPVSYQRERRLFARSDDDGDKSLQTMFRIGSDRLPVRVCSNDDPNHAPGSNDLIVGDPQPKTAEPAAARMAYAIVIESLQKQVAQLQKNSLKVSFEDDKAFGVIVKKATQIANRLRVFQIRMDNSTRPMSAEEKLNRGYAIRALAEQIINIPALFLVQPDARSRIVKTIADIGADLEWMDGDRVKQYAQIYHEVKSADPNSRLDQGIAGIEYGGYGRDSRLVTFKDTLVPVSRTHDNVASSYTPFQVAIILRAFVARRQTNPDEIYEKVARYFAGPLAAEATPKAKLVYLSRLLAKFEKQAEVIVTTYDHLRSPSQSAIPTIETLERLSQAVYQFIKDQMGQINYDLHYQGYADDSLAEWQVALCDELKSEGYGALAEEIQKIDLKDIKYYLGDLNNEQVLDLAYLKRNNALKHNRSASKPRVLVVGLGGGNGTRSNVFSQGLISKGIRMPDHGDPKQPRATSAHMTTDLTAPQIALLSGRPFGLAVAANSFEYFGAHLYKFWKEKLIRSGKKTLGSAPFEMLLSLTSTAHIMKRADGDDPNSALVITEETVGGGVNGHGQTNFDISNTVRSLLDREGRVDFIFTIAADNGLAAPGLIEEAVSRARQLHPKRNFSGFGLANPRAAGQTGGLAVGVGEGNSADIIFLDQVPPDLANTNGGLFSLFVNGLNPYYLLYTLGDGIPGLTFDIADKAASGDDVDFKRWLDGVSEEQIVQMQENLLKYGGPGREVLKYRDISGTTRPVLQPELISGERAYWLLQRLRERMKDDGIDPSRTPIYAIFESPSNRQLAWISEIKEPEIQKEILRALDNGDLSPSVFVEAKSPFQELAAKEETQFGLLLQVYLGLFDKKASVEIYDGLIPDVKNTWLGQVVAQRLSAPEVEVKPAGGARLAAEAESNTGTARLATEAPAVARLVGESENASPQASRMALETSAKAVEIAEWVAGVEAEPLAILEGDEHADLRNQIAYLAWKKFGQDGTYEMPIVATLPSQGGQSGTRDVLLLAKVSITGKGKVIRIEDVVPTNKYYYNLNTDNLQTSKGAAAKDTIKSHLDVESAAFAEQEASMAWLADPDLIEALRDIPFGLDMPLSKAIGNFAKDQDKVAAAENLIAKIVYARTVGLDIKLYLRYADAREKSLIESILKRIPGANGAVELITLDEPATKDNGRYIIEVGQNMKKNQRTSDAKLRIKENKKESITDWFALIGVAAYTIAMTGQKSVADLRAALSKDARASLKLDVRYKEKLAAAFGLPVDQMPGLAEYLQAFVSGQFKRDQTIRSHVMSLNGWLTMIKTMTAMVASAA